MASKKRLKVSDQVRQVVEASGLSRYRIWQQTGIDQTTLSRFMSGERGLSSSALDTLGELLDLRVVIPKPPRK